MEDAQTADRRHLARALQLVVGGVLAIGLLTRNVPVVVNAAIGLGVTLLPAVLHRDLGVPLTPRLGLLIAVAVCLHTVGMVGLYETTWWWDHLTHALSATAVASMGYAVVRAFDVHSEAVSFPPEFLALFVFLFTVALGVVWEVLEFGARGVATVFGVEPVVVQYGLEDTVLDLIFDMAGATVVALFGTRRLRRASDRYAAWFDSRFGADERPREDT